jgi:hypothetical protein
LHRVFGFASKNRARRKAAGAFFEGGRYVGTPSIGRSGAVFEAPTFVPGLDDIAVVSEPVEHGRSHFVTVIEKSMAPLLEFGEAVAKRSWLAVRESICASVARKAAWIDTEKHRCGCPALPQGVESSATGAHWRK